MLHGEAFPLLAGAIALGFIHGIEPGHGWPVAASYALDQANKWLYGFAASSLIGIGHLISSLAMVGVFFYAKSYFQLTQVNEPISILGGITIGGPVSIAAGVLLIGLGIREYTHGHSHDHEHDHGHTHEHHHDHEHDEHTGGQSTHHDHATSPAQKHSPDGLLERVKTRLRGIGGPPTATELSQLLTPTADYSESPGSHSSLDSPTRRNPKSSASVLVQHTVWN